MISSFHVDIYSAISVPLLFCTIMKKSLLAGVIFVVAIMSQSFAQKEMCLTVGAGIPDFTNATVRFPVDRNHFFGFGLGVLPLNDDFIFTLSSDYYYYFVKKNKADSHRKWFATGGLTYFYEETSARVDTYLYSNADIGRRIRFTSRAGLSLSAGLGFEIIHHTKRKTPSTGWGLDIDFPIFPSLNIDFYFIL